jgi:hypothetical protein
VRIRLEVGKAQMSVAELTVAPESKSGFRTFEDFASPFRHTENRASRIKTDRGFEDGGH